MLSKITATGFKIMEAEELSIGDKIAEKYSPVLSDRPGVCTKQANACRSRQSRKMTEGRGVNCTVTVIWLLCSPIVKCTVTVIMY